MTLTAATSSALWLALPALALLLLFRLLRAKRKRVLAGSLLIWKRLEALPVSARPKRVLFDLSLFLQAATVLAIVAALSGPMLVPHDSRARTVLMMLDNGTLSRARDASGKPAFEAVLARAKALLERLGRDDRVYLARGAPLPAVLNSAPLNPAQALARVDAMTPALSGPDVSALWLFAADRARVLDAQSVIFSLRAEPAEARRGGNLGEAGAPLWIGAAESARRFDNVAIVEAGSLNVDSKLNGGPRVLVRVANFSDRKVDGSVRVEAFDATGSATLEDRRLTLDAGEKAVAAFRIPREERRALRIGWRTSAGTLDALPEDDSVMLAPRPERAPRVRFHTPHPALENLLRLALNAQLLAPNANEKEKDGDEDEADLDVYVGSVPERLPEHARAALFVAPERGYRSFFDVGEKALAWPAVQRGAESPLNVGFPASENSGILIPKAYEILRTGDFTTLLRDAATGRALAARFVDEQSRPCLVLAFSPGAGLPDERRLDPPLAALLVRMTLEAQHAGPPYARKTAAELETAADSPLPLNWRPALSANPPVGAGVLNERASDLRVEEGSAASAAEIAAFLAAPGHSTGSAHDLTPWFGVLALGLAMGEFFGARGE